MSLIDSGRVEGSVYGIVSQEYLKMIQMLDRCSPEGLARYRGLHEMRSIPQNGSSSSVQGGTLSLARHLGSSWVYC